MFKSKREKYRKIADADLLSGSITQPWMFEILVERYERSFLRRSEAMLRDKAEAQDVVQDTFLRMYRHAAQYKEVEGARFSSWAYRILVNACYNRLRSSKRTAMVESYSLSDLEDVVHIAEPLPTEQLYASEVLSELPSAYADLLRAHYLEGRSQHDLAEELGLSYATVRSKMHRAKEKFRTLSYRYS